MMMSSPNHCLGTNGEAFNIIFRNLGTAKLNINKFEKCRSEVLKIITFCE